VPAKITQTVLAGNWRAPLPDDVLVEDVEEGLAEVVPEGDAGEVADKT